MRKIIIITGALVLLIGAALYFFFTYGSHPTAPGANSTDSILQTNNPQMSKGDPNAPVKMVEYADILCPYCAKVDQQILPKFETDYVSKGKLHIEMRIVGMIAPDSKRAGEGAYCAADQNKFWQYVNSAYSTTWNDYYAKNKKPEDVTMFSQNNIASFAQSLQLDMPSWNACMKSERYASTLDDNQKKMIEIKAYGTPEFLINNHSYNGAPPYEAFKAVIDSELEKVKQ